MAASDTEDQSQSFERLHPRAEESTAPAVEGSDDVSTISKQLKAIDAHCKALSSQNEILKRHSNSLEHNLMAIGSLIIEVQGLLELQRLKRSRLQHRPVTNVDGL